MDSSREASEDLEASDKAIIFVAVDPSAKRHAVRPNWRKYRSGVSEKPGKDLQPEMGKTKVGPLTRTISPTFGALQTETFQADNPEMLQLVATHCMGVIWPDLLHDETISREWFSAFCNHPVIYHGFHYAAAVHADASRGTVALSEQPQMLKHKIATIHLLRKMLSKLESSGVGLEVAIHGVLLLASTEIRGDSHGAEGQIRLPVSPHFPAAGWTTVFARLISDQSHATVLKLLLQRAGGLEGLKFPGLGDVIALADLISSSLALSVPAHAPHWSLSTIHMRYLGLLPTGESGKGFRGSLPDSTPQRVMTVFTRLAQTDKMMSECRKRRLATNQYKSVIDSRNAVQHDLLSLLIDDDQEDGHSDDIRLCRATCLLYSNSVIFPLPPDRPWRTALLQQVVDYFITGHDPTWRTAETTRHEMLIWSACIAALLSVDTPLEAFLVPFCKHLLDTYGISSTSELCSQVLEKFVWSDEACGRGLEKLWAKM